MATNVAIPNSAAAIKIFVFFMIFEILFIIN